MADTRLINKQTAVPGKRPGISDIALGEIAINTYDGKMYLKQDRDGNVDVVQVGDDPTPNVYYVSKGGRFGNLGTSLSDAFKTLDSAFDTIKTLKAFSFDEGICRRDLGLIIKGLNWDIAFGTNYNAVTSGLAYQRAGSVKVLEEQLVATRSAFNEAKGAIASVPAVKASSGYDGALERSNRHWAEIVDILVNGQQSTEIAADPIVFPPPPVLPTPDADDAAVILQKNREWFKKEVVQYIVENFPDLTYDRTKCSRDTGYIIDALTLDLVLGTNFNSITAGLAYYRGNASYVLSDQIDGTVGAIQELGRLINLLSIDVQSKQSIENSINEIVDIIRNGSSSADAYIFPNSTTFSSQAEIISAFNGIRDNRDTIVSQTVAWVNDNYPALDYDEAKCARDVGFILDGLAHDMLYGGNYQSRVSADAYFVGTNQSQLGAGEVGATIAAYEQLKVFVNNYMPNTDQQLRVNDYIDIINEVLQAGTTNALRALQLPNFAGADATAAADYSTIVSATDDLKDGVIAWADQNGPTLYDRTRCKRDVGFIIDGITFDVLYGGTFAIDINTRAYFSFGNNQLGSGPTDPEVLATVSTYQHLKQIVDEILGGNLTSNLTTGFDNSGNNGQYAGISEVQVTAALFDILIDAITAGNLDNLPTVVEPNLNSRGVSIELKEAINGIAEEQDIIITQSVQRANATNDIVIFLKSGDYVIQNPIKMPPKTAIVGDNLRTTTIRPNSVDSDLFYMDNGCFIKDVTFRDHQRGAACVAYDPKVDSPGAGPFIVQSPYVQNCTSITTDGIGMKIDGSKCSGLRSMVSDAFTQYNAAGTGVYLLNRGYAQLVSIFTISTQTSIRAETGGQCSITNSNSSFGDFGLVASGSSPILYQGTLDSDYIKFDDIIQVNGIVNLDSSDYLNEFGAFKKPNYGDAMIFDSENYFYTVLGVDSVGPGIYNIQFEPPLNQNMKTAQTVSFRQRSVITSSSHTFEYVGAGTNTFTAIPQNGGIPKREREVVFDSANNEGLVVFTSTDQLGDFRIGSELTIRRQAGRIEGETFERSLYAILTPYILALEG